MTIPRAENERVDERTRSGINVMLIVVIAVIGFGCEMGGVVIGPDKVLTPI